MKLISAVAVLVVLCGSLAQAAVITVTYTNIQTSTSVAFSSNVTDYGNTPPANIPMTAGMYIRFGINLAVTGNSNPAAGGAWDSGNQAFMGNPAQPTQLGIAVANMTVNSTNANGSIMAAQGTAATGRTNSRVQLSSVPTWALTDPGDVGATVGSSGIIGAGFNISTGNVAAAPLTTLGVQQLAYYAGGTVPGGSEWFHASLGMFKAITTDSVTLSPNLLFASTNLWENTGVGTVDGDGIPTSDATYGQRALVNGTDTIIQAAPININVPEPTAMGLLALGLVGLVARRRTN